ncbi:MAG: [FeFe] hydrogenase H-cluster radical SAM maturase HydG, partial [Candidatus Cloacimonetes bacterium]|nr:[FeFe] hydrogenase H-cluster radical SAM maturase HydG [Candidatus Cloacimonadota bacterium]
RFCTPNALLTFSEYLYDYSSDRTLKAGLALIDQEVAKITDPNMKKAVVDKLAEMKAGTRDLFF